MEPTSLTECGYPRPDDRACGGYGFWYLNAVRASLELYHAASKQTLLAMSAPLNNQSVAAPGPMTVSWTSIGAAASQFQLLLDGEVVATLQGVHAYSLELPALSAGVHTVTVRALDATTQ
jgi:hypothetical protein